MAEASDTTRTPGAQQADKLDLDSQLHELGWALDGIHALGDMMQQRMGDFVEHCGAPHGVIFLALQAKEIVEDVRAELKGGLANG